MSNEGNNDYEEKFKLLLESLSKNPETILPLLRANSEGIKKILEVYSLDFDWRNLQLKSKLESALDRLNYPTDKYEEKFLAEHISQYLKNFADALKEYKIYFLQSFFERIRHGPIRESYETKERRATPERREERLKAGSYEEQRKEEAKTAEASSPTYKASVQQASHTSTSSGCSPTPSTYQSKVEKGNAKADDSQAYKPSSSQGSVTLTQSFPFLTYQEWEKMKREKEGDYKALMKALLNKDVYLVAKGVKIVGKVVGYNPDYEDIYIETENGDRYGFRLRKFEKYLRETYSKSKERSIVPITLLFLIPIGLFFLVSFRPSISSLFLSASNFYILPVFVLFLSFLLAIRRILR